MAGVAAIRPLESAHGASVRVEGRAIALTERALLPHAAHLVEQCIGLEACCLRVIGSPQNMTPVYIPLRGDETQAIQAAIMALPSHGGILLPGTARIARNGM